MALAKRTRSSLYNKRRHWYHVSTTLEKKHERLVPWDERKSFNRDCSEPSGKRICVAPTIEQCITAIPYCLGTILTIYRTKSPIIAKRPQGVYDSHITEEGWIEKPMSFVKVGILKFEDIEKSLGVDNVAEEAASSGETRKCGKVLKWWKRARIRRFIKRA